jgi:hypothetical protein
MGKGGSDGSLLPTLVQQSGRGAQLQKLAFMGFLSLLLTVNLFYFVKTHAKMESIMGEASAHGSGVWYACMFGPNMSTCHRQ